MIAERKGRGYLHRLLTKLDPAAASRIAVRDKPKVIRALEVRLETGTRQPEAIRLYESAGYQRIAPYGDFKDSPLSVCFEKSI